MHKKPHKAIVRRPYAPPILHEKVRSAFERLSFNPKRFVPLYERQRLHFQATYAQLVQTLRNISIEIQHAPVIVKKRRKATKHAHYEIRNISVRGAVQQVK